MGAPADFYTRPIGGTSDGWRGRVGAGFTPESVATLARAIGAWTAGCAARCLVAGDCRESSPWALAILVEELVHAGCQVTYCTEALPTPVLSWSTAAAYDLGVTVTASHNPPEYNGVKLRAGDGASISTAAYEEIAANTARGQRRRSGGSATVATRGDLVASYLGGMNRALGRPAPAAASACLCVDAMHGTTGGVLAERLGSSVVLDVRNEPLPDFGGGVPDPRPSQLDPLRAAVAEDSRFVGGFAHDGDGDRVVGIGTQGEFVDAATLFAIGLFHLALARSDVAGAVVRNTVTSRRVDDVSAALGLEVVEVEVGIRHVAAELRKGGTVAACEENGGMVFTQHLLDRDGIFAAALVTEAVVAAEGTLTDSARRIARDLGPWVFERVDEAASPSAAARAIGRLLDAGETGRWQGKPVERCSTTDGVRLDFSDGWIALRKSGTEDLVRVYTEARTQGQNRRRLAAVLEELAR